MIARLAPEAGEGGCVTAAAVLARAGVVFRPRTVSWLVEAEVGPLPLEIAFACLERQACLPLPVKVILGASGAPALLAEIPSDDAEEVGAAREEARRVLRIAVDRLVGDGRAATGGHGTANGRTAVGRGREGERGEPGVERGPGADGTRRLIAEACAALGWPLRDDGSGGYRIDATGIGMAARILVGALPGGAVRVSGLPMALRITDREVAHAIGLYALAANGCLRLARLSLEDPGPHLLHARCEVILPLRAGLAPWIAEAVEALAVASAESGRALRALATRSVASAHLDMRSRFINPPASPAVTKKE